MSELLRIPLDRDFGRRIRWLIGVRWLVLTVVALLVLVANPFLGGVLPVLPIWGTILGIALYNGGFWLAAVRLSGAEHPPLTPQRFIAAQIATDLVALTVLLHFSGGIENPFSTYYIVLLALGACLPAAAPVTSSPHEPSVLWIGLCLAEAFGVLPHVNLTGLSLAYPLSPAQPTSSPKACDGHRRPGPWSTSPAAPRTPYTTVSACTPKPTPPPNTAPTNWPLSTSVCAPWTSSAPCSCAW
jgi:hypothetical protein